jgi:type IV secretion system protein VirB5
VVTRPPATVKTLRKNPLGLYVDAIDWSKELDATPPAAEPRASADTLPLGSPLDPGLRQPPLESQPSARNSI